MSLLLSQRRKYSTQIKEDSFGKEVIVAGWVHDIRNLGGISFILLRDREGILQITAIKKNLDKKIFDTLTSLSRESVIAVKGEVNPNKEVRNSYEILPKEVQIISKSDVPLPLGVADKVSADLDTRLDNRFLDARKLEIEAIFRIRHSVIRGIREYLDKKGFVEIQTPKIVAAGAEGGATLFPIKYFDKNAYLAQSPQLYKQIMMATGLDRVYEIAPAFRAELSDTVRHTAEFCSFDAEIAFIDSQEDVLKILEESVVAGLEFVKEHEKLLHAQLNIEINIPKLPVPRITYLEAIGLLKVRGKSIKMGEDIDTEAEKLLGEIMYEKGCELYYIIEYPTTIKPFYIMAKDDEPKYSYSFDLDYKGQEIASGGQREHRYEILVNRMKELNLNLESFEFYLKAFRYGMPPHGGWGLGIDRLIQKILNLSNIRETILFPRDRVRLEP